MPNTHELREIFHDPYGLEHPYDQAPTERFPRDPKADQPVILGVASRPAAAAQAVWASWMVAGENGEGKAEGRCTQNDEEASYWRVQLPAFRAGQRVTYRLHARQGDTHMSSEPFSFVVAGWCSAEALVAYHVAGDHVELEGECTDATLRVHVELTLRASNCLHVQIGLGAAEDKRALPRKADRPQVDRHEPATEDGNGFRIREEAADHIYLENGHVGVTIQRRPFRLQITGGDGRPLLAEAHSMAWLLGEGSRPLRLRQVFDSPADEAFYGFGERFNALNQRGHKLDVRVFEQYKNQGRRTYLPIPFCLSSQGYGLYLDTNRYIAYDLASSRADRWSFDAELGPEGLLEYDLIVSDEPKEIIRIFTDLTGKPALPPTWAFGPWMSGNEWNSQASVMEQAHRSIQYQIPVSVLVIEAWSDETTFYIWNDAQYSPKPAGQPFAYEDFTFPADGLWPDPKGMIEELHQMGIRVLLWQIPVMKQGEAPHPQRHADEAYMLEKGYCVYNADGTPYRVRPFWFHNGLVLDFTNDDAVEWWLGKRAYLLEELEVDGFKTDGGEHIWGRELRFADGRRGDELWNLYPNLYVGAYHRFARQKRHGDAITFSRAGFTGAQRYPCHWAGDEDSTWEAFRASIIAGLNAGISGVPFWGWDLAGFSGEIPSAELYLRAAAMAAFCPIMQYHSEYNEHRQPSHDRTPWNIAERTGVPAVIDVYRRFAQLRMQLLPYIETEARHCATTGEPLMRPLFLDWPRDPQTREITDQFCFGRALLVAPIIEPDTTQRRLYLPPGEWQDFWDGTELCGGRWITRSAPLDIIPVYRRLDAPWPAPPAA